jgi:membrane protein
MSLIPMLMIVCAAIPFTPLTEADLMSFLREFTPESMDPMMISLVEQVYDKSAGLLSLAVIITVWSAGKGMLALMRALNTMHGVAEERGYIHLRLVSSFYTIMVLLVLIVTLGLGVFGNYFKNLLIRHFPILTGLLSRLVHLRFLVVLLLITLAFTLIYTYIPNRKVKLVYQVPGAVFVALAWNIFSYAFSIYVDHFNSFSAYGTLGTVMLFLLWLYFCSYIMLLGASVNLYFKPMTKALVHR